MRLIDADALIERLKIDSPDPEGVDEWIDIINNAPTVDVLEQIRAEIDEIEINGQIDEHTAFIRTGEQVKQMALQIIDKYR